MTAPRMTGATAAGEHKRTLWPWLLLAAVIAGLLIWWLVAALDDDGDDVDPGASVGVEETIDPDEDLTDEPTDSDPTEDASPTSPVVVPVGLIYIGDVDILDPAADLTGLVGETVEGNTVDVVQLVADEAFYVGPEIGRTIMVRLENFAGENAAESPFEVEVGDQVSFTGTLQEIDQELLDNLQLFEGVEQVESGDYFVQTEDITLIQ